MAKKKDLGITPDMLKDLNKQTEEDNKKIRQKKEERSIDVLDEFLDKEIGDFNLYSSGRVDRGVDTQTLEDMKNQIQQELKARQAAARRKFDRKRERPIQKTVHLTIEVDNKVNMVKSILKTLGKKTTFEDLLFDLLENWLDENYDKILDGKVVYPGEDN